MNLAKKKTLAQKVLKIGKRRISFVKSRIDEIKEALTKQDIRDLYEGGAIIVKDKKGRRAKKKGKRKRGPGKIKKTVNKRKREYVVLTRKLRKYVAELKKKGELSSEEAKEIRKKIRNRNFRSKSHLKEYIGNLRK